MLIVLYLLGETPISAHGISPVSVAVQERKVSYSNKETRLFTMYPYYGILKCCSKAVSEDLQMVVSLNSGTPV